MGKLAAAIPAAHPCRGEAFLAFRFYLFNFAHVVSNGAVFLLRSLSKSASFFLCVLCGEYLGFGDEAVRFHCDHAAAGSTVFARGVVLLKT